MSRLDVTTAVWPEPIAARLRELDGVTDMTVHPVPAVNTPLDRRDIARLAEGVVALDHSSLAIIAALSPRRPSVDGIAWLDFQTVAYYTAGADSFASIGTFSGTAPFQPFMRIVLATPPTGAGALVTCRATSIAVGPHYPGYFRVEGPGVAASFEDNARPTTFTFVVPPSAGTGPVEVKVYTDPDRIQVWAFHDCTITQL